VCLDWILGFLDPDSCLQQDRSVVFFAVAGAGLDLDFVFAEKTLLVLYLTYFNWSQTGIGLFVPSWYRIQREFRFQICKTGLDPDSKK